VLLAATKQNNKMITNLIMVLYNEVDDDMAVKHVDNDDDDDDEDDDADANDDDDVEEMLLTSNIEIPRRFWKAVSKNIL